MSSTFQVFSGLNDGAFLSCTNGDDRTFEVISMLAASKSKDVGKEEFVNKDKNGIVEQYFANKNAKPATPEAERDAIDFATNLAKAKRVDVYNFTKDESGRTKFVETSHVVGEVLKDGSKYGSYAMVNDEGKLETFENGGFTVVHKTQHELVTALGNTYLGNPDLYKQVESCCPNDCGQTLVDDLSK